MSQNVAKMTGRNLGQAPVQVVEKVVYSCHVKVSILPIVLRCGTGICVAVRASIIRFSRQSSSLPIHRKKMHI
jgi:hypothetical protein